jgi:hypothetical protein
MDQRPLRCQHLVLLMLLIQSANVGGKCSTKTYHIQDLDQLEFELDFDGVGWACAWPDQLVVASGKFKSNKIGEGMSMIG